MNAPAFSNASADLALAVYLEPHADDRRVLLLGQVDAPLASHLERLAAHLDLIDPSTREPARGEVPELPFDDEAFDLIVVAELSALPEPWSHAIRELRRVLSRDGLLAVASSAAGKKGAARDTLGRLLSAELRHVRVLSQTPTHGYTLHDEAVRDAELAIDASLTRREPPQAERLLGLASDARVQLEARLWVQVPGEVGARSKDVDPRFVEALRKAEEEARQSLRREADLQRELQRERKASEAAEQSKERLRALERKLLAIEADYDDAVARVRYFEGLDLERESSQQADQQQRDALTQKFERARSELSTLRNKLTDAEAARDAALLDAEAAANEGAESEQRFAAQSQALNEAQREAKRHEGIARDLLEELRGLEQRALVAVEHDARVSELEAERERAMQRALEAEVARESAQLRVDELRAQLEQPRAARTESADDSHARLLQAQLEAAQQDARHAQDELSLLRRQHVELTDSVHIIRQERVDVRDEQDRLRGERTGLTLRLAEAEQALRSLRNQASDDDRALDTKLALAEARAQAALEALGEAEQSIKALRAQLDDREPVTPAAIDTGRIDELESQLVRADRRIEALERELEEADRFAEDHAEDAERVESLELQLDGARQKLDTLDDEVRALQDELFNARTQQRDHDKALFEAQAVLGERDKAHGQSQADAAARIDQLLRRENELRSERDDAHAALAEARAILSLLAARVGADTHDLPSIVQALEQHTVQPSLVDSLRKALAEAQTARSDSEYQAARIARQLEDSQSRVRELESNLRAPQDPPQSFDPPEV